MLILACDTSGSNCSVALLRHGHLLAEYNMNFGKQHSVLLMPLIEEIMAQTGVKPNDLTHLAVNLGPGSFTGLRIGLSVLEAMSYALGIPLYGYTSFEASAQPLLGYDRAVLILHDALKKTFYSAAWVPSPQGRTQLLSPAVRSLEELKEALSKEVPLIIAGDGLVNSGAEICATFPAACISEDSVIQRASSLARLCLSDVLTGTAPRETILPRYMRKPQAEREYEAKHGHSIDS